MHHDQHFAKLADDASKISFCFKESKMDRLTTFSFALGSRFRPLSTTFLIVLGPFIFFLLAQVYRLVCSQ
jgi:hypothetical protein